MELVSRLRNGGYRVVEKIFLTCFGMLGKHSPGFTFSGDDPPQAAPWWTGKKSGICTDSSFTIVALPVNA